MRLLFFLVILFISPSLFANNSELFLIGGGGDLDAKANYGLAGPMMNLAESYTPQVILFDGVHTETKNLLQNKTKTPVQSFKQETYRKTIEKLKAQIKSGEYKDKNLILYISNHGAPADNKNKTHELITDFGYNLSADELGEISDLCAEKISLAQLLIIHATLEIRSNLPIKIPA